MPDLSDLRTRLLAIVVDKGLDHYDEPLQLASGEWSQDFIDAKRALADGPDLEVACRAMIEAADDAGATWDAVGGLTMTSTRASQTLFSALSRKTSITETSPSRLK